MTNAKEKLLNWGDKTICRFENGSVQDKAHNSLLIFLRYPENMRTYLMENEVALSPGQFSKLLERIDQLAQNGEYRSERSLLGLFFKRVPSEENGFRAFSRRMSLE